MDNTKWYLNKDRNRGGWIYAVVDSGQPSRVRYIGKTQVSVQERSAGHWYDALRVPKRTNSRMVNWLLKRSNDRTAVVFQTVGFYNSRTELDQAEKELIRDYRELGMADLNITDGGDGQSCPPSDEARKKMSEAHRGDKHHNAKLTWGQVREIRRASQQTYIEIRDIAAEYKLSRSNVEKILNNRAWIENEYDPRTRVPRPVTPRIRSPRKLNTEMADSIRAIRKKKWVSLVALAKEFGISKSSVSYVLLNETFHDPEFDPRTLKGRKE